jgi:hypothetical protein
LLTAVAGLSLRNCLHYVNPGPISSSVSLNIDHKKVSCQGGDLNDLFVMTRYNRLNIAHTIERRKSNWVDHILRGNCLLKHVIEGKIEGWMEVTGRRRRGCKQLLYARKEKRED